LNFIAPEHACLPRHVKAFWNIAAIAIFMMAFVLPLTSCLGVVLGLSALQDAFPAFAQGFALVAIAIVKSSTIGLSGGFLTVAFCERHHLAKVSRDHLYEIIEEEVMPMYR
jgi:hypothetical protein